MIVGLVYVALSQFGVAIPAWVTQIFWIVVVAFCVICAIKLVAGMWPPVLENLRCPKKKSVPVKPYSGR